MARCRSRPNRSACANGRVTRESRRHSRRSLRSGSACRADRSAGSGTVILDTPRWSTEPERNLPEERCQPINIGGTSHDRNRNKGRYVLGSLHPFQRVTPAMFMPAHPDRPAAPHAAVTMRVPTRFGARTNPSSTVATGPGETNPTTADPKFARTNPGAMPRRACRNEPDGPAHEPAATRLPTRSNPRAPVPWSAAPRRFAPQLVPAVPRPRRAPGHRGTPVVVARISRYYGIIR